MDNFRQCVLIDTVDLIFSPDYLVIQFINKFRGFIKMKHAIDYKKRILKIGEDKDLLPFNNIIEKEDGSLCITNLFDEEYKTDEEMLREFIKTKNSTYIFKDILQDIQKEYGDLFKELYPLLNMNISGIYMQNHNFILYDNTYYNEESILRAILPKAEQQRLVDKTKIWEFFGTYTDQRRNIGLLFTMFSADTNIMKLIQNQSKYILEWQKPLINMEMLFLTYTNNNLKYAQNNKEAYEKDNNTPTYSMAVVDLWEDSIISKIMRATPYSIL